MITLIKISVALISTVINGVLAGLFIGIFKTAIVNGNFHDMSSSIGLGTTFITSWYLSASWMVETINKYRKQRREIEQLKRWEVLIPEDP